MKVGAWHSRTKIRDSIFNTGKIFYHYSVFIRVNFHTAQTAVATVFVLNLAPLVQILTLEST